VRVEQFTRRNGAGGAGAPSQRLGDSLADDWGGHRIDVAAGYRGSTLLGSTADDGLDQELLGGPAAFVGRFGPRWVSRNEISERCLIDPCGDPTFVPPQP